MKDIISESFYRTAILNIIKIALTKGEASADVFINMIDDGYILYPEQLTFLIAVKNAALNK